jgi:hypothetical protein
MSEYQTCLAALHRAIIQQCPQGLASYLKKDTFLEVYTRGYISRLIDTTLADFPGLAHYLGESVCKQWVSEFVRNTPSPYWDLNLYPVTFAHFLSQRMEDPAAISLARLEAAITEVFWLPTSAALNSAAMAGLTEDQLDISRFKLRTESQLLQLFPAMNQWLEQFRAAEISEISQTPEYLLVYRPKHAVQRLSLTALEYQLLAILQTGTTFGEALTQLSDHEDALQANLSGYLTRWLQAEIFSSVIDTQPLSQS